MFHDLVLNFKSPIDLVWLVISALISMTDDVTNDESCREMRVEWMNKILSKCEETVEDFVSRSHSYFACFHCLSATTMMLRWVSSISSDLAWMKMSR